MLRCLGDFAKYWVLFKVPLRIDVRYVQGWYKVLGPTKCAHYGRESGLVYGLYGDFRWTY